MAMTQTAREPAPGPAGLPRLLAHPAVHGGWVDLRAHRETMPVPPAPHSRPDERLLLEVEASGLKGRGGAAFPTAVKLRAVAAGRGRPVVVVNGSEGEPAGRKDRLLLATRPHLVLDGALVAATAVGAAHIFIGIDEGEADAHASVRRALEERRGDRLLAAARVVSIPHRYVAGEERSLVRLIDGGPAIPSAAPPRPFERGVAGRPTLVQNVETMAHLAQIAAFGAAWFRQVGTEHEPGSRLVTVSGAVAQPGVYEIASGTPVTTFLRAVGGTAQELSALLLGGYFGTWLGIERAAEARLSDDDLRPFGAGLGSGVVFAFPAGACGVVESARVARWFARQSADQCGPCVYGLAALGGGLAKLARREADAAVTERLLRWAGDVEGRGACRLPDGAVRFVRSALGVFGDEVDRHRDGVCSATVREPVLPIDDVSHRGSR
jgi:NADH:ubiquinone oxidoreductase subunit F (NADH-binding)